jgi:hypothetical protein
LVLGDPVLDDPVLVCALTWPGVVLPDVPSSSGSADLALFGSGTSALLGSGTFAVGSVVLESEAVDSLAEEAEESVADALVDDGLPSSASAVPCPVMTAVPTPNATANPPTRPMYVAAPIAVPSLDQYSVVCRW